MYRQVHVGVIVLISTVVGAVFMGVLALIEGASIRLANRRLRRELQKLETENNFLRTQRSTETKPEPDAFDVRPRELETVPSEERLRQGKLPSAPVYDPGAPTEPD